MLYLTAQSDAFHEWIALLYIVFMIEPTLPLIQHIVKTALNLWSIWIISKGNNKKVAVFYWITNSFLLLQWETNFVNGRIFYRMYKNIFIFLFPFCQSYMLANKLETLLWMTRVFTVISTILFILPLFGWVKLKGFQITSFPLNSVTFAYIFCEEHPCMSLSYSWQ